MKRLIIAGLMVLVLALSATADVQFRYDPDDGGQYLWFGDSNELSFGASKDVTFNFDGTNFELESLAASTPFKWGAAAKVFAITLHGSFTMGVDDTGYDFTAFGATSGQKLFFDASADTAFLTCTVDIDGSVTVGVSDTGYDVQFFGATAGDYLLFDESGDELILEDITLNLMDDTILSFGDGDDATIQYDEDGNDDLQITGAVGFDGAVDFADTVTVAAAKLVMTGTSATWDPASLADGAQESKDFTVTGVALGDAAIAGAGVDVEDLIVSATVTAADTVTVVLANETGGAVDLASSTWYVYVILDD